MKKVLFIAIMGLATLFTYGQYVDLSEWHDMETIWDQVDANIWRARVAIDLNEAELTNSAGLIAALSDETGTGVAVFGTSPTVATPTITGVADIATPSVDSIIFANGASISNLADSDTLQFTETNFAFHGAIYMEGAAVSDYAITDEQLPFDEYWAKTLELNRLPAMENRDRRNLQQYVGGLEEAAERNLRYIVELEARLKELEAKLDD